MQCPRCNRGLQNRLAGDVYVDVCEQSCGGIWLDQFELKKLDEPHESVGESLLTLQPPDRPALDLTHRLGCPKCPGVVMMRHFASIRRQVEVDECPTCAGFWLDHGELGRIRALFESEAQRIQATEEYFDEIFGEKLAAMRAESAAKLASARKIAHAFRFICPSYYIPGDQDWGAF